MEGVIILSNNKPLITSHFVHPHLSDLAIDAFLTAKRAQQLSSPVLWFDAYSPSISGSNALAGPLVIKGSKGKGRSRQAPLGDAYEVESDSESEEDEEESVSSSDEEDNAEEEDILENDGWRDNANGSTSTGKASHTTRYACCHIRHNTLNVLAPIRGDADPSTAFAYLYSLLGVLKQYLGGEVTDHAIRDNFDIVLQLFGETLSPPYPISTDASALQELVPSSSLLAKLLNASLAAASSATSHAAAAGLGGTTSGPSTPLNPISPFSSPLHWRRAGIKHPQNEIYFDVNEDVRAILDKNGNVVAGDVWGRIDCRSKLSGMPDISMTFSNPNLLDDLSFHPCVRLGRWTSSKLVSFVPPDGEFELLGYRLSQQHSQGNVRQANAPTSNVPVPFRVRPIVTVGEVGGSFNISLSPPTRFSTGGIANLEEVTVSLYLGSNAVGVTGSISSATSSTNSRLGPSSRSGTPVSGAEKLPPGGKWDFDPLTHTLKWRLANLSPTSSPTLSGTWHFDDTKPKSQPSPFVEVSFSAPLSNISGLSIVNLKLEGERYSVYKGFRSNLKGSLEVRW